MMFHSPDSSRGGCKHIVCIYILPQYNEGPPQAISSAAGHSLTNNLARSGKSASERVLLSSSSMSMLAIVISSSFWSLSLPPKLISCFFLAMDFSDANPVASRVIMYVVCVGCDSYSRFKTDICT